jgi:hypothetical protein
MALLVLTNAKTTVFGPALQPAPSLPFGRPCPVVAVTPDMQSRDRLKASFGSSGTS